MELYAAVRLAVVDEGLSHHEAGRRFGIDRRTVKKMLSYSAPPGYRRTKPVKRPKLDGFTGIVDAILEADTDPEVPRKQPAHGAPEPQVAAACARRGEATPDRLRRGQAPAAGPHREAAGPSRPVALSAPAPALRRRHAERRLRHPAGRRGRPWLRPPASCSNIT